MFKRALVLPGGGGAYIYTLADPNTGEIRYVGKTTNLQKRMHKHLSESRRDTKSHKRAWIASLLKQDKLPIMEVLEQTEDWKSAECYWIAQMKAWGFRLVNTCEGGEGVDKGNVPWNKGVKGSIKPNSGTLQKGTSVGVGTQFKKGEYISPATQFKAGQAAHNRVNVIKKDLEGNVLAVYESYKQAGLAIGVTYTAIRNCIVRGTYKCKGYIWER